METNPASRAPNALLDASASRPMIEKSFVDTLFGMPDDGEANGATASQKEAEGARLEARLAAEIRELIAARLKGDEAA